MTRRRVVPWRAIGLGVVALVAIVGVARAAGADGGGAPGGAAGTAGSGWETLGGPTPEHSVPDPELAGQSVGDASPADTTQVDGSPDDATPADATPADATLADPSPDWWSVLAELDARRVRALTEVDPALLPTYAQSGSTAWSQDAALLADLSARGLRPDGLTSRVLAVERISNDGARARLQLVDERSGYSMVDSQGAVIEEVEPAGPRRWTVTLGRLAPTVSGPEPADPAGNPQSSSAPDSSGPPDSSAVPSPSPGRDPGWRVVTVVPVQAGQSSSSDARGEASTDTEDGTAGGAP